jgi:hypothetical protein
MLFKKTGEATFERIFYRPLGTYCRFACSHAQNCLHSAGETLANSLCRPLVHACLAISLPPLVWLMQIEDVSS